jgi:hypothetical protein
MFDPILVARWELNPSGRKLQGFGTLAGARPQTYVNGFRDLEMQP